jgi:hypothetical protein
MAMLEMQHSQWLSLILMRFIDLQWIAISTASADMVAWRTARTAIRSLKSMSTIASTMVQSYSSARIVRISITYDPT